MSGEYSRNLCSAYILIQAQVGKGAEVGREAAAIKGVTSAVVVTGPYDVIAFAEAGSIDELGKLVVAKIARRGRTARTRRSSRAGLHPSW